MFECRQLCVWPNRHVDGYRALDNSNGHEAIGANSAIENVKRCVVRGKELIVNKWGGCSGSALDWNEQSPVAYRHTWKWI